MKLLRLAAIVAALLVCMGTTAAQQITITGTVLDPTGKPYAGGSGRAQLTPTNVGWTVNNGHPINQTVQVIVALDSFGRFSIQLLPTNIFDQQSSNPKWQFSFCAASTVSPPTCFTMIPLTLTTGQDISSQIQSQSALLPATGGGGTIISVNSALVGVAANFNNLLPAPGAGFTNVLFQVSGPNISAEVPTSAGGAGCTILVNEVAVGTGTNTCGGFTDFTYVDTPTPILTLAGTDNGTLTEGSSSAADASGVTVHGGSGPTNTNPSYYCATASPADASQACFYPCDGGHWCISQTPPSADSTQTIPTIIASGQYTIPATTVAATSCSSYVAVSAPGVLSTDVIPITFSGIPTGALLTGLRMSAAATNNFVNFAICNDTAGSLTPPSGGFAATLNWSVSH